MKKAIGILLLAIVAFYGCQKETDLLLPTPPSKDTVVVVKDTSITANRAIVQDLLGSNDGDLLVVKDTTIDGDVDFNYSNLRFTKYKIHGKGTIRHFTIVAAYTSDLFDTTLTLVDFKCFTNVFSCAWYGAKSTNLDNYNNIQKSINVSYQIGECLLPLGVYKVSKTLELSFIYQGAYVGNTLHFHGESSFWGSGTGTTILNTAYSGGALNLQLNKGSEIDHLTLRGQWISPSTIDTTYFNTLLADYKDQSGYNINNGYYGLGIDSKKPLDGVNNNGSTGLYIHDMDISGFQYLIAMSQNRITRNADILIFTNIHLGNGQIGVINGNPQEKGNRINGLYCWGSLHTLFCSGVLGSVGAGDYTIDGGNIAGRVIRGFWISASGWFKTSINNMFFESIATIGDVQSANLPMSFNGCTFDLNFTSKIGKQIIFRSNNYNIGFYGCIIRYNNGGTEDIWTFGYATYGLGTKLSGNLVVFH